MKRISRRCRKAFRRKERDFGKTSKRYHDLVDKYFISGTTAEEALEQETLRLKISAYNAPFYESMIHKLEARIAMPEAYKP